MGLREVRTLPRGRDIGVSDSHSDGLIGGPETLHREDESRLKGDLNH